MFESIVTGELFCLNKFTINGSGPIACIVAGVHGNEYSGVLAVNELEQSLKEGRDILQQGTLLTLIANKAAIKENRRYIDFDLNRSFSNPNAIGHEAKLSKLISPHLKHVDFLLDLHATSAKTVPFCAGERSIEHLNIFKDIDFNFYTHGWEKYRGYTMLINEVNRHGGVGLIAECGEIGSYEAKIYSTIAIENFLNHLSLISKKNKRSNTYKNRIIEVDDIFNAKTDRFSFIQNFKNFDLVSPNHPIAIDGDEIIIFPRYIRLIMPSLGNIKSGEEVFGVHYID